MEEGGRGACGECGATHLADIPVQVLLVVAQIEEGVGHKLARLVVGDLAAPASVHNLGGPDLARRKAEELVAVPPPQRVHRRVLEQKQHVLISASLPLLAHDALLQA